MMANLWHSAATPRGYYAHQIDPLALDTYVQREMARDPELTADLARAEAVGMAAEDIRRSLGFPVNGRWAMREAWNSSVSEGEPHPNFLARCRADGHEPGSWPLP